MTAGEALGAWLRELREDAEMSRALMALLAGCAESTVYNAESGRAPQIHIAARIMATLELDLVDLVVCLDAAWRAERGLAPIDE